MIFSIETKSGTLMSVGLEDDATSKPENIKAAKRMLMYAVLSAEFPGQVSGWPTRQVRVIVNGEEPTEQDKKFMSRMEELKAELGLEVIV